MIPDNDTRLLGSFFKATRSYMITTTTAMYIIDTSTLKNNHKANIYHYYSDIHTPYPCVFVASQE